MEKLKKQNKKKLFQKNLFRNTIGVSNILDSDHAQQIVQFNLGNNWLEKLSAGRVSPQITKQNTINE